MTDSLIARFRAKGTITRVDKIECAPDLSWLTNMIAHWPDMTEAEHQAVARRKAELMRGKA